MIVSFVKNTNGECADDVQSTRSMSAPSLQRSLEFEVGASYPSFSLVTGRPDPLAFPASGQIIVAG